jgi:2-polyprenyl-6-methoxyphenol hydroxylase-like FAD-dependent oxidoreductase
MSPASGCGANPPPSFVGSPSDLPQLIPPNVSLNNLEKLVVDGCGCSPLFPRHIVISGAGTFSANGVYSFAGEMSNRPYFQKIGGRESIWYFSTCPISQSTSGAISYNGWYLSNEVGTSRYSSSEDMYSCYSSDCIPQLTVRFETNHQSEYLTSLIPMLQKPKPRKWIVRSPSLPPLSGCGMCPVPSIEYLIPTPLPDQPAFVMLLRLYLPNGEVKSLQISELDSILRLKLMCEEILHAPFYSIRLLLRGTPLSRLFRLNILPHEDDHQKVFDTGVSMGDIITVEIVAVSLLPLSNPDTNICIIGAGPVGLWIAIQLKVLRSSWSVTCYEKRSQYERSHALSISSKAFEGMVEWCPGRPAAAELSLLKERWIPRTRTSTVEGDLKSLALTVGVNILYDHEVTSLTHLIAHKEGEGSPSHGKKYDLVICCDGAKGQSRQQLLSFSDPTISELNQQPKHRSLGSLLQVKFEAHGEVSVAKGQLAQFLQNLPATEEFFSVLPGNFDSNKCSTPMTVFALLSSDLSATISVSSADLEQNSTSANLLSDLEAVLFEICSGGIIEGSMKTTILPVSYSVAPLVTGKVHETSIFLAGDAAMGLPLEKGLNYGWKIASRLCHYLAYSPTFDSAAMAFQSYFALESTSAIEEVERHYSHYVHTIQSASALRAFLRPLASFLLTTNRK